MQLLQKANWLKISELNSDVDSEEYEGFNFRLGNKNVKYRKAKITSKKIGQFVTLWKRDGSGKTVPFDVNDGFDFYLIAVEKDERFGVFVFPKRVLGEWGILSNANREGKRGFRVYAEWDSPESKQAQKTRDWQCGYFMTFSDDENLNREKFELLWNAE